MARIRTVKPELFKHSCLYKAEKETGLPLRLAFIGLFGACDKEGRFKWRPDELKLDIFPYDDIDMNAVLDALHFYGFIKQYALVTGSSLPSDGFVTDQFGRETDPFGQPTNVYGCIPSWKMHQRVRNDEAKSNLPPFDDENCRSIPSKRNKARAEHNNSHTDHCVSDEPVTAQLRTDSVERKGKERKGIRTLSSKGAMCSEIKQTSEQRSLAVLDEPHRENPVKLYCDLWKTKNGKSPDIRGKEAGQLTQLAKDLGHERACEIIRVYFSMPDPFFIKRGYDIGTMLMNLAAIQQFEASGKVITREVVKQVEKQVDKIQGTKKERSIAELIAEKEEQDRIAALSAGASYGG